MDTYPPIVQNALGKMDEQQQLVFRSEYEKRKRNVIPMLLATIFLIHFFFYGRTGLGIVFILVAGCLFIFGGGIWWLVEVCMTGKRVRDHNDAMALDLARDMKMMT